MRVIAKIPMRWMLLCSALNGLILVGTMSVLTVADAKTKITKQADLPRFSYEIAGTAAQFVEADDAAFNAFANKVRSDINHILADYEVEDKSTMRVLLAAKLDLQELFGEYRAGLQTIESLRALEEKPSSKLTSGLFARARLQAALETGATSGLEYENAFRMHYRDSIDALPWDVVQDDIKSSYAYARLDTRAATLGYVKTELDPAVLKSGAVDNGEAWNLVGARDNLRSQIPLGLVRSDVLHEYIALHDVVKPEIWSAREATLHEDQHLTPVLVGVWDSGIDVSLFPKQLFTDPIPTASGSHGLAFDDEGKPSIDWLHPLTAEQQKAYPEFRELLKGILDLEYGMDSPEAAIVQKKFNTLSPDEMHEMMELNKVIGHYVHGTHCAGIAVRGNPAARLVVARFNDNLPDLPFAPTEQWARRLGDDFQKMGDYFRTRHVRVVNMSWGDDAQEFETWLSKTGGGADPEQRKKRAEALFAIWREAIANAIKSAPDTLFVTAAGNSDSNVGFIEDVPASLRLPNLISVGAVNQAGDETSFTSHGDTVVVHASGYWVESFVPGGTRLKLSGTSMAAPNVVNLAAKLFALDPALSPSKVISLIKQGATTTADGRRYLIDENRSIALLGALSR
jgi:subtilisin family serine protease